jgi:hypothetical protein
MTKLVDTKAAAYANCVDAAYGFLLFIVLLLLMLLLLMLLLPQFGPITN